MNSDKKKNANKRGNAASKETKDSVKKGVPSAVKKSDKEKKLEDEIKNLKDEIIRLECNLDPVKIIERLKITEESLVKMLSEENLTLRKERSKYVSGESEKFNDTELLEKVKKLEKDNKTRSAEIMQIDAENAKLKKRIEEMKNLESKREKEVAQEGSSSAAQKTNIKQSEADSSEHNDFESQLKKKDGEISKLNEEIEHLKNGAEDRKRKLSRCKSKVQEIQKEIGQLKLEKSSQTMTSNEQKQSELSKGDQGLLQEKITELEILKKTINEQRKTIDEQKIKIEEHQKRIEEQIQTISEHKKDTTEVKAKLHTAEQKLEDQVRNLKDEKTSNDTEKKKSENELESLREQLRLKDRQVEDLKNTSANAEMSTKSADELKEKLDEITSLKNKLTSAESKIGSLESDKSDLKKKAEGQTKEKEEEIQRVKEEKKNLIDENKKLKDQTKEKESEIKIIKEDNMKTVDEKEKTIKKLRKEMDEANRSGKTNAGSSGLQDKLKSAQDEIDELKNRLSKVVGANIMNDNPNITDLSDENRPTKLSEKFSELYDNEWTDAFEEAENEFKTEEKGIDHLYKTLLDVFEFCKKKSEEHAQNIRNCVTTLPNSPNGRPKTADIGVTNHRQLKEIRKSFAPMLVDSVFQNYLKEKKLKLSKKDNTERFIRKCVEICWLMNSQDPPVILDTTVVTGKSFDSDKFRTYTKTGKAVEFVVWPPMLLHKDGPMLCKGVAQGK